MQDLKREKQREKFALPLILAIALAAVSVCAHVIIKFQGPGISMLFWLVAAWAVLALVYYIYQRIRGRANFSRCFSFQAVQPKASRVAMGMASRRKRRTAIAVVSAAALWLKKNDGVLPGKDAFPFLPPKADYTVLLATCGARLAAVAAAMLLSGMVAYYLIYVMIIWLFALFVYYTVKLM